MKSYISILAAVLLTYSASEARHGSHSDKGLKGHKDTQARLQREESKKVENNEPVEKAEKPAPRRPSAK